MTRSRLVRQSGLAATAVATVACVALLATGGADSDAAATRTIKHPGGTSRVPVAPRRIVSLHPAVNEALASLQSVPVAGERVRGRRDLVYGMVRLADVKGGRRGSDNDLASFIPPGQRAGWARVRSLPDGDPNVESVLKLNPDLILAHDKKILELDLYGQLNKIAPTVLVDIEAKPEAFLRTVAKVLGRERQASQAIAVYRRTLSRARARLTRRLARTRWAILRVSKKELKVKGDHRSGRTLFSDLRLRPAAITPIGKKDEKISMEAIPRIDATHLVILTDPENVSAFDALKESPLWRTVPAVKKGQVYLVPRSYWEETGGVLSSKLVLEDMLATFGR